MTGHFDRDRASIREFASSSGSFSLDSAYIFIMPTVTAGPMPSLRTKSGRCCWQSE
jgi:hypothetical protein